MVDYTETFTAADGDLGTAFTNLTWTIVLATAWAVTNTQASPGGASRGTTAYARAEHDTDTADQYAEFTVMALEGSTSQGGPCARFDPAANNSYMAMVDVGLASVLIRRTDAGSRTTLATVAVDITGLPKILRTEAEGSTIRGFWNGVQVATATDTTYPTQTRAGMYGHEHSGAFPLGFVVDNFAFGDLGGGTESPLTPAIESSSAQGVIGEKLGVLSETVSIDQVIITPGAKAANLQVVTDSSNALGLTPSKTSSLSLAVESNLALALSSGVTQDLGVAIETNIALTLESSLSRTLGIATEFNSALILAPATSQTLGIAIESTSALGVEGSKTSALAFAFSSETGVLLTGAKLADLQLAQEITAARVLASSAGQLLGVAIDDNTARVLAGLKTGELTEAITTDEAIALLAGFSQILGVAESQEQSLSLSGSKSGTLSVTGELTIAQLLRVPGFQLLQVAVETNEAVPLTVYVLVLNLQGTARIVSHLGTDTLLDLTGKARMRSGQGD